MGSCTLLRMTEQTRAKWVERVREWRDSGLTAEDFTAGKDYAATTLRWAVSQVGAETAARLTRESATRKTARRRRATEKSLPAAPVAPRFVPVRVRRAESVGADMVLEVGVARVRVRPGFDEALLAKVVRALSPGGER